ncbi:MAG: O-antigen ligase family protein, partial [Actinomycetota bacterium]|nr:O-antigen ligase family protein [Actinomycetota bacterium]
IWSLSSTAWSEALESAVVSGNRWLVYGALLVLLLVLVSHDRRAAVLLAAAALGVGAVALSVLVRLLGDDPGALFLGARLNSPLGYINGEGCLFVIGFWLSVAASEFRRALVAGPALGMATLMACLALLSQSRGTALAMIGSLVVVLVLVPWSTRRAYALLVVAGAVALAAPALLRVYDHRAASAVPLDVAHTAGRAALIAVVAVGIAWSVLSASWERAGSRPELAARARRAGSALLVVPVIIALVLGAISAHRIERDVRTQWHSFVRLSEPGENALSSSASHSRLLSGAGNRYDYWRIAWRVWKAHPLLGVGAGNYPRSYYERRATTEDIQQPHSIELQVLSELGLLGGLLLGAFLAGVGWGAARARRRAAGSPLRVALMTGSLGVFVAWLVQASVDWMHLLPGLSAIALAGGAVLIWPSSPARAPDASVHPRRAGERGLAGRFTRRRAAALGVAGVILSLIVAGASLSRQGLADLYRTRAQSELSRSPARALADANRSLGIDADAPQSYYVKAAALARFDQAPAAEAALVRALAREPGNFVTWTLLGDIAVRRRNLGVAKRDYAHARELNPRNPILQALSQTPGAALR